MEILTIKPPVENIRPNHPNGIEMEMLRESIKQDGLLQPITVNQNDIIIDGYRRWTVCRELGWTDIPVHRVTGDPERLRIIAQTRRHEFGPNDKKILVGSYLMQYPEATAGDIAHRYQWTIEEVELCACVPYLEPVILDLYRAEQIPLKTTWFMGRIYPEKQAEIYAISGGDLTVMHDLAEEALRVIRGLRRRNYTCKRRVKHTARILKELNNPTVAGPLMIRHGVDDMVKAWQLALSWVLNEI